MSVPRGNWGIILALVGWLILTSANQPDTKSQREQADAQEAIANHLGNLSSAYEIERAEASKPKKEGEPCQKGDDRRYSDLCAQWKAADAASDSAWWAWASGVVGVGSLIGVATAIGLAFHSNWIARDTARRQLRAYMGFARIVTTKSHANKIRVQIEWKNSGQTPATNARCASDWAFLEAPMGDDFVFALPRADPEIGTSSVLPGESIFTHEGNHAPYNLFPLVANESLHFYVWGRINYDDVFGSGHWTEWAAEMSSKHVAGDSYDVSWIMIARNNGMGSIRKNVPTYQEVDDQGKPIKQA